MGDFEVLDALPSPVGSIVHNDYTEFVRELKRNPGKWIKLPGRFNRGLAGQIRRGGIQAFLPAGAFDAKALNSSMEEGFKQKRADVYVSYVGGGYKGRKAR